ncbi:uncharacterized protein LOC130635741 isoform X1 [Hydractinia symbiolongicarpus]|uniref:uncharacterized protein LOC130635741 isoform X1 n=1 Tax=Hydractinia symbiolongicarpus TaxID=13093 RepID=UPI0025503A89|nr:uncharacterized protein LOC130635741 isoform X1 [Hydractinia symbiolongicarpus]
MVLITTVYMNNSSCVYTTWRREDTGIYTITYHLQFNNQEKIYSTLNTYLKVCNLRNPTVVTIWASYKGRLGRNSSISITLPLMKTTTTTNTTRTATKRRIASDSNMHSVKGKSFKSSYVQVRENKSLSATFTNSRYRLMLRNIRYNESFTFQLYVIYGAGDHLNSSRFNIQVAVKGTPKICGVRLKSNYTVVENSTITFTQDVCAHPKPVAEWKLDREKLYKKPSNTSLINTEQRKYRFTYQTRKLTRNDCGAKFILKATNAMGSVEETVKVDVIFKPPAVFIKSISRHNASCVKILWQREKMGNCILSYQLQFDGNSEIFFTSNTYFTMCTQLNITSVGIWATHKGEIGDITVDRISPATPAPETKEISADESKLTIKLIVILVIGSFVFTVILNVIFFGILLRKGFVILNFKTKKQHQNVANKNAEEYEVMGTTISNYTDINLHAIKPSVYADLKTTTDDSNQYAEIGLNDVK